MRKLIIRINYLKLFIASVIVALLATLLADTLKNITARYEEMIIARAMLHPLLLIVLPSVGITLIYFMRKYLFKGRKNKGIKEIYQTIENRKDELPAFKIPSHYFNGFLTVIFGGSTGVEVSTVVATATIGAVAQKKQPIANVYKTELICAGVTAGIAALFGSPLAGMLFAIEVIARKVSKTILVSTLTAALVAWAFMFFVEGEQLFHFTVTGWRSEALPFFIVLGLLAAALSVYFTRSVIFIKDRFSRINNNFIRVNAGALAVGLMIFVFPQLYGDSYHAIPALLHKLETQTFSAGILLMLASIVLLKPLAASLTLGAGGDGGVFAPSIVAGALLGMLLAAGLNHYLHTNFIVLNFLLVGAAAVLSASIHAPLTAIFLTCSIAPGGYLLFIPILTGSFVAKYAARMLCPYTVYSYRAGKAG